MAEGPDDLDEKMEEDGWEYYDDNDVLPDFWQDFVTNETDFAQPLDNWLRHFTEPYENAYGWCMYREFWRVWVPLLLAPRHGTTSVDILTDREEERVRSVLIRPLEQFICGQTEVESVWQTLSSSDAPSDVCGHVFKPGETCYNCKDCGQDATCVLCVECFMVSEHKNHRYRISTSEGGGYCDCGDPEAFTSYPHCSKHQPSKSDSLTPQQVLDSFPPDLRSRAEDVIYNVLRYCLDVVSDPKGQYDLVSGLKEKELFPDLKFPLQYSNNCCVLINDENHSFHEVIRVLDQVLAKPGHKLSNDLTIFVDKYGKAVIKVGDYKECSKLSDRISAETRLRHATVLKTKVVSSYVVAHQDFVSRLLNWIPSLFEISSGFRALFAQIMFQELKKSIVIKSLLDGSKREASSLCQAALLNDFNSWKQVRHLWLSLVIGGLMKDYESKRKLAIIFTDNYPSLVEDYLRDDQEREACVMSLSVQIFTVPSLALYLMEHHDAMSKLIQGFLNMLKDNNDENDVLNLTPWQMDEKSEFQRGLASLYDLNYLLAVVPSGTQWNSSMRSSLKSGVGKVMEILSMMQSMDMMKRQVGHHVEMEDNGWRQTYELQTQFNEIVKLVINWCVADKSVLIHMIEETLKLICLKHEPSKMKEVSKCLAFLGAPQSYDVIDYDVGKQSVSLHVPLHRFLVSLLLQSHKHGLELTLKQRLENSLSLSQLMEPVLQTLVTVAQISAGMWKRNGHGPETQVFLYSSKRWTPGVREADLLLLQLVASLSDDIDTYMVSILSKFKLAKWASGDIDSETGNRPEDYVEQCNAMAEQYLSLMIALASERVVPSVGEGVDERAVVVRDVIHLLCVEPLPHSAIVKRFQNRKIENELDGILKEIGVLKPCTKSAGKKVYHLKEGLEAEYNMFYPGYTKEQQTQAQEYQLQLRAKAGEGRDCCPPPVMPKLTRTMGGLVRLLGSNVMLQTAQVILRRACDHTTSKSKYVTERQVHKVLYLLALGVQEQKVETAHSQFVSRAVEAGIVELLGRLVHDSGNSLVSEHVKKLASWIIRQCPTDTNERAVTDMEVDNTETEESENLRKRRAEAVAARRAKIMAQMNAAQKNFAAENKDALDTMKDEKHEVEISGGGHCSGEAETVCLGPGLTTRADKSHHYTCILCQEESQVGGAAPIVLAAFITKSTVLSQELMSSPEPPKVDPHHLGVTRMCGPHVSTCGHAMHAACYQKFFSTLEKKEQERNQNFGIRGLNIDVTDGEFLCPICERLSNTVLPLLPSVTQVKKKQASMPASEISFNSFINGLRSTVDSWYLKEDKENGAAMSRIALKTTLDEQSQQHGPEFCQNFRVVRTNDGSLFDEATVSMMNVFSMSVFTTSLQLDPYEEDYRVPLVSLQSTAFTLSCLERSLWNEDKPLFGSLNPREEDLVRQLTRYVAMFPSSYNTDKGGVARVLALNSRNSIRLKFLQSNAILLLSTLLCKSTPDDANPLHLDSFACLVSLTASLPCLFNSDIPPRLPSGQAMELHCLKLCLLLHIVQVLNSFSSEDYKQTTQLRARTDESKLLDKVLPLVLKVNKMKVDTKRISAEKLCTKVEEKVLPFLRCSALLFQHFTDVLPGKNLAKDGGKSFSLLARYLGLPSSVGQLLENPASTSIMINILDKNFSSDEDTHVSLPHFPVNFRKSAPNQSSKQTFPLAKLAQNPEWKYGLIPLPRDYTDLMNLSGNFSCVNSVTGESKTPSLCLVCGVLVCSMSHCCETLIGGRKCGGCTAHARTCGADVGIFLRIRECIIVIHSKVTRGAFLPAPYLDEYGEADKGLKRGNPLYLDMEKYEELNRMWLRNEVPEKIARMFDPEILMYIEWNTL